MNPFNPYSLVMYHKENFYGKIVANIKLKQVCDKFTREKVNLLCLGEKCSGKSKILNKIFGT